MRVPLLGGPYQSRSVIASAQKSVNIFPEANSDPQAPVPVTHYPTSGTTLFSEADPASTRVVRQTYTASNGNLYAVIGNIVYSVANTGVKTGLGFITDGQNPVYLADNGLAIVLVDGTATGYAIDMATNAFGVIVDPSFYGADQCRYIDTYFVFNRPDTNQWYISLPFADFTMLTTGIAFDPLDIVAKTGGSDNIVGITTAHNEIWIVGFFTSEVWYLTGAADFPFARVQGAFINHGCAAPNSIATQDILTFWLSQDYQGHNIVVQGANYDVSRISTHAIEAEFQSYPNQTDAIGFCYQQEGHAFYILTFPTANKTWAYELVTKQWHELAWTDTNGVLNRHRANCCAFAYNQNIIGDWQNGRLYILDPNVFNDNGLPITRIRTFPHMITNGQRVYYKSFIIDIAVGNATVDEPPTIYLRWSDDRGVSYGNKVEQSMGDLGEFLTQISYNRLGMARDRVFEISWSCDMKTALNGAFVEAVPFRS